MGHYILTIDRSGGRPTLESVDAPKATFQMYARSRLIAHALLEVEKVTGIPFHSRVVFPADNYRMSIVPKKNGVPKQARGPKPAVPVEDKEAGELLVGQKYLTENSLNLNIESYEAMMLHEMGHQFYKPHTMRYRHDKEAYYLYKNIADLTSACKDEPQKALAVLQAYGSVEAFKRDFAEMGGMLDKRYAAFDPASVPVDATDTQMAQWLLSEKKRPGSTPLFHLDMLDFVPERFGQLRSKLYRALQTTNPGQHKPEEIAELLEVVKAFVTPEFKKRVALSCQLMRGEEDLCDAYAVQMAHNPHAFHEALQQLQPIFGGKNTAEFRVHPPYEERMARVKTLADEEEARRGDMSYPEYVKTRAAQQGGGASPK